MAVGVRLKRRADRFFLRTLTWVLVERGAPGDAGEAKPRMTLLDLSQAPREVQINPWLGPVDLLVLGHVGSMRNRVG